MKLTKDDIWWYSRWYKNHRQEPSSSIDKKDDVPYIRLDRLHEVLEKYKEYVKYSANNPYQRQLMCTQFDMVFGEVLEE